MIRELVKNKVEPSQESLTIGSEEFRKLAGMLSRMTNEDGISRVRLNIRGAARTVIVCPTVQASSDQENSHTDSLRCKQDISGLSKLVLARYVLKGLTSL